MLCILYTFLKFFFKKIMTIFMLIQRGPKRENLKILQGNTTQSKRDQHVLVWNDWQGTQVARKKKCPWNITIHVTQSVSGKIPKKLVTVIVSGKKNRGVLNSGVVQDVSIQKLHLIFKRINTLNYPYYWEGWKVITGIHT